jgi:hypothetical protein
MPTTTPIIALRAGTRSLDTENVSTSTAQIAVTRAPVLAAAAVTKSGTTMPAGAMRSASITKGVAKTGAR